LVILLGKSTSSVRRASIASLRIALTSFASAIPTNWRANRSGTAKIPQADQQKSALFFNERFAHQLATLLGEDHFGGERLGGHLSVANTQIVLRELANLGARTGGKPGFSVFHA
jgi:hypothetical protein